MSRFTPDQLAFIDEPGHCVAIAGPGSGKTTALIEKVYRLCAQPGVKVMAATFTSDGAAEMRHRLDKRIGAAGMRGQVNIGTWHSLCIQHRKAHGFAQKTLDPGHQANLLKRCIAASRLDGAEFAEAMAEFESIKCSVDSDFNGVEHEWFQAYQDELATLDCIDLYDVVRETALQMARKELPLFKVTHLIIDETQDNDDVQYRLAHLHATAGITTTMVGDDDQAIYEWRRARGYSGMQDFTAAHQARIVTLGDNFRSLRRIVEASDELIQHNQGFRLPKKLVARRGAGGTVQVTTTSSWKNAAETILASLEALLEPVAASGLDRFVVATGSVAILARNNYVLDEAETELLRSGIKYLRASGSIWSSEPAGLLMTVLATTVYRDARGLDAALQLYGLPAPVISQVNKEYRGRVDAFVDPRASFSEYGGAAAQLQEAARMLREIGERIEQRQFGSAINKAAALVRRAYTQNTLQAMRHSDVLSSVATGLIFMKGPLQARLKQATEAKAHQTTDRSVILQTFHAAKGQEYRNVFLLGVDDEILPGKSDIRAERRLLYVAMTRAKDNLQLTHTAGKASRFLSEFRVPGAN